MVKESNAKPEEENMVLVRLQSMSFVPYKKEQNVPAKKGSFTYKKRPIAAQSSGTESISGARCPGIRSHLSCLLPRNKPSPGSNSSLLKWKDFIVVIDYIFN